MVYCLNKPTKVFLFSLVGVSVSREKELARIVIKKEDVDLIVSTIYTVNLSLFNYSFHVDKLDR